VPRQRFEGLAGAAEAVVKSDRSCWESKRTFNNLQTKFLAKVPRKEFFNAHETYRQLTV
jgi:hypothetical protein